MESGDDSRDVRFYSVASNRYFLGLVGLINSVRANGHADPFVVVDLGLTTQQRALLEPHVELIEGPPDVPATYLKSFGMEAHPADVMVFADADVLCVGSLMPVIDEASAGRIVVFADPRTTYPNNRRGSPPSVYGAWEERLGLHDLTERPYVNAGALIVPRTPGMQLLLDVTSARKAVSNEETFVGRLGVGRETDPFYYADQDLLNALLASPRYFDAVTTLAFERSPTPPYDGVGVSEIGIKCASTVGTESPYFLHHAVSSKPWLTRTTRNVYLELLVRALNAPEGPVRLDVAALPPFLRVGRAGESARRRRGLVAALETRVRGRMGIRRALSDRRRNRHLGREAVSIRQRAS